MMMNKCDINNFAGLDVVRILNYHSAKTITATTARTEVKPTWTEVEMASLLLDELLVEVAPPAVPVAVADPDEPPEPPDGVVELELEFSALDRKAAKVWLAFALTANTIPFMQWPVCLQ